MSMSFGKVIEADFLLSRKKKGMKMLLHHQVIFFGLYSLSKFALSLGASPFADRIEPKFSFDGKDLKHVLQEDLENVQDLEIAFEWKSQRTTLNIKQCKNHLYCNTGKLYRGNKKLMKNVTCGGMKPLHYDGDVHVGNVQYNSSVYLFICNAIIGSMKINGTEFIIATAPPDNTDRVYLDDKFFIFNHKDLQVQEFIDTFLYTLYAPVSFQQSRREKNPIRKPYNANETSRYIELALVIDNAIHTYFKKNDSRVHQRYQNVVNKVNSYFQELNIYVALVDISIWSSDDLTQIQHDHNVTYKNFIEYAGATKGNGFQVDNVQFITKQKFSDNVLGKGNVGNMCGEAFGINHDELGRNEVIAEILAHEMMQNMGVQHCIMGKQAFMNSSTWSSCTTRRIAKIIENREDLKCLNNMPTKLFNGPVCGNGFTEPGEQCDCGFPKKCDNPCCNPRTCKLYANASCAIGECCNLKTCRLRSISIECRLVLDDCDLPEYCDGQSEYCPEDVFKNFGEPCSNGSKCHHDTYTCDCEGPIVNCSGKCYGNGFCNSKGHCHCRDGFAPPFCQYPGFGGSIDSGPARYPHRHKIDWEELFYRVIESLVLLPISIVLILFTSVYALQMYQTKPVTRNTNHYTKFVKSNELITPTAPHLSILNRPLPKIPVNSSSTTTPVVNPAIGLIFNPVFTGEDYLEMRQDPQHANN